MAELALELLCQRAASRSTFGKKLYQHVSPAFDPSVAAWWTVVETHPPPLSAFAGGRDPLDRRVPPHDRADPSADAARCPRPGHHGQPGCSQTGEAFASEVTFNPTFGYFLLSAIFIRSPWSRWRLPGWSAGSPTGLFRCTVVQGCLETSRWRRCKHLASTFQTKQG